MVNWTRCESSTPYRYSKLCVGTAEILYGGLTHAPNSLGYRAGTGTGTDTMPKYRYRSRSHISPILHPLYLCSPFLHALCHCVTLPHVPSCTSLVPFCIPSSACLRLCPLQSHWLRVPITANHITGIYKCN